MARETDVPASRGRRDDRRAARVPAEASMLLSSHDAAALERRLVSHAGGAPSAARSAAARVVRHAFAGDDPPAWDEGALAALGIGAWAHAALLELDPSPSFEVVEEVPSTDATLRLLLRARDGALVESVVIPGPARTTVCISSQVGCARGCAFCETGRLGLDRQLSAGEIVDQVRVANRVWSRRTSVVPREEDLAAPHRIQNVVFMGMGEPFDNLDNVLRAIALLTDPRAFAMTPSRITVSTVGVGDKLAAFFAGTRAELAVSLNAPDDTRRSAIMPVNARCPLDALRDAIAASLPPRRRVLFEYVLFDEWNDAPEDADLLAGYLRPLACRVNLIPCNPGPDPALRPPRPERVDTFARRLSGHGVTTLVRRPRGRDVGGACGQLAGARRLPLVRS